MTGTKSGGKLKISVTSLSGHIKLTNLRLQIKNTKMQFEMLEEKIWKVIFIKVEMRRLEAMTFKRHSLII